jgi:hypothetical protein
MPSGVLAWGYERGTIAFARWALIVSIISALALCGLAIGGAIPGQTRRAKYTEEYLGATPLYFSEKGRAYTNETAYDRPSEKDAKRMGQWINTISALADNAQQVKDKLGFTKRLVWIEQDVGFKEPYQTFVITVYLDSKYEFERSFGLLLKERDDQGSFHPTYRQLTPLPDSHDKDKINARQFWVHEPSRDEKLIIIGVVKDKEGEVFESFPARKFDVKLRVSSQ